MNIIYNNNNLPLHNNKHSHIEYAIVNNEWKRVNNVGLYAYLASLNIPEFTGAKDGSYGSGAAMRMYIGVGVFYLRKGYVPEYINCGDKARLDPWCRKFPVFPTDSNWKHKRSFYDYEWYNSPLWGGDIKERNVYVIGTSVNQQQVYCVDILNGLDV
jgi:hypothetical protein